MSDDSSEEKKHDASQRKLRKQREKGNVVQSRETTLAVSTVVGLSYIIFTIQSGREIMLSLFEVGHYADRNDFLYTVHMQFLLLMQLVALYTFPLLLTVAVLAVGISVFISGGFVFTTEKMKPEFTKFNPAKGFKNIFSMKSLKTFIMNLVRIAFVGAAVTFITYYYLPSIMASSNCGYRCGISANALIYFYVFIVLILASIVFAVLDYIVQRAEFLRQQKMTETEKKQEAKEQHGSPEIKGRMNELRQEIATKTIGLNFADFIIADGLERAIGIHYERGGDMPPVIVAKGRGPNAVGRMIASSKKPAEHAPEIFPLISKVQVGDPVTDEDAIRILIPFLQKYT